MPSPPRRTLEEDLHDLVDCHGTPGDEDEVARTLAASWRNAGWEVQAHGRYAVSARLGDTDDAKPTLLVCAHMDSPGFAVQSVEPGRCRVIALGQPRITGPSAEVVLKTHAPEEVGSTAPPVSDRSWVLLQKDTSEAATAPYWIPAHPHVRPGDRLCFHGTLEMLPDGTIRAPFLDNRLGCAVLCELARCWKRALPAVNVVLGATAAEEMGSIGAPVLAGAFRPDIVVCVDATYESPEQGVLVGGGPVLTLSDASVVLGCRQRDRALACARALGIPLQTEVYNVSGTDSRAFPASGLQAPVYALLLPTRHNHSPMEVGCRDDARHLVSLLVALADGSAWKESLAMPFGLE